MTLEEEDKVTGIRRSFEGTRFELSPKWVRVRFGGRFIVDSQRAHLLYEPRRLPVYYFPLEDVADGVLAQSDRRDGTRAFYHVVSGGSRAEDTAWSFDERPGFVAFRWNEMDAWFEEDEEVFVHAKDPYHRVDVLRSTRHIRFVLDGETLAESHRPVVLFETGLPPRYYLPLTDVRMDLFERSETRTECPYKGEAEHLSARVGGTLHADVAWTYKLPTPESAKIQGLVAFYQERIDETYIDGELQPELVTPWARRPTS